MRTPTASSSTKVGKTTTTTSCCSKVGLKRGPWTAEEDELLASYIKKEGEGRWRTLPKRAGLLRCGKSCRLRWMNYLRPSVKRGHIAPDEEDLILRLHRLLGNRWSLIAGRIPGRTDNEIKNYWNTHLSKKLISQGIDPRTHKPLNPNSPSYDADIANANPKASSPSSKGKHIPSPPINNLLPDLPPARDLLDEALVNPTPTITNDKAQGVFTNTNTEASDNNMLNLQNSDSSGNGALKSSNNEEEEDGLNHYTDDVFSSFLNSLINEDSFNGQYYMLHQPPLLPNGLVSPASDALIECSTSAAFKQNDPRMLKFNDDDHVERAV